MQPGPVPDAVDHFTWQGNDALVRMSKLPLPPPESRRYLVCNPAPGLIQAAECTARAVVRRVT